MDLPLLIVCAAVLAPSSDVMLDGYLGSADLEARIEMIARSGACAASTFGTSHEGRPLVVLTLSGDQAAAAGRPALLLTAGLDGTHPAGTEITVRVAERLIRDHADLLNDITVYVLPQVNPDAARRQLAGPRSDRGGALRVVDEDHDGLDDEDGPQDLNGDGVITLMRRPPTLREPATMMPDPAEPRLMRAANGARGEIATAIVETEGRDVDRDGRVAEDGLGQVDLDRNFMHLWPAYEKTAGLYPLSEPESLALARFVIEHPNVFAAITWGRHDNVVEVPSTTARHESGAPEALHENDREVFEEIAELYRATTGQTRAEPSDPAGSFHAWMYAQRGIPSVASSIWGRPDPTTPDAPEVEPESPETEEEADDEDVAAAEDEDAAAWLQYSDLDRGGIGFVEWTPFRHPDFGEVEIGGFRPGFRLNPPADALDELAAGQLDFAVALAERRPRLRIDGPGVDVLAPGLYEIRVALVNDGRLPTLTHMAATARAVPPTVIRIDMPLERIVAGDRVSRAWGITESGGRSSHRWIIRAAPGETVDITLGAQSTSITVP